MYSDARESNLELLSLLMIVCTVTITCGNINICILSYITWIIEASRRVFGLIGCISLFNHFYYLSYRAQKATCDILTTCLSCWLPSGPLGTGKDIQRLTSISYPARSLWPNWWLRLPLRDTSRLLVTPVPKWKSEEQKQQQGTKWLCQVQYI